MCPALVCGAVCRPAGKKRCSTLIECGNDINSTDIGKIADWYGVCVWVRVRVCAYVDAVSMYSMPGVGCEGVHVDILV